jgi:hypothetical protein
MNTAFCAICTHNYYNYSKLLFDSLKSVGHHGEFFLLIIDYQKEYSKIISTSGINIVTLETLQIPEIKELIERYNPFELCNVLKPYFLEWVLNNNKDLSTIIYLDSDIYVYNPFDDVIKYLKNSTNSILLVPNFTGKSKLLGETDYYEETIFFRAGLYCGGFYALKNDDNSRSFLKWHKLKLRKFGYNAPAECMFVDQKILDLAPLLFDFVSVYKNESYNVGHWNYKENPLTFVNNRYYINNKPLVFFHFSYLKIDFNDESKDVLLNIKLTDDPILHDLCKDYWRKLINLPNYSKRFFLSVFICVFKICGLVFHGWKHNRFAYGLVC